MPEAGDEVSIARQFWDEHQQRFRLTAAALVLIGVLLLLVQCGGSEGQPTASPSSATPSGGGSSVSSASASPSSCSQPIVDLVVWFKTPGQPAYAQALGSVDQRRCGSTVDLLAQISPTGAGNCTLVAYARSNPGYDVSAEPAPRPRKVIASFGDC